MVKQIEYQSILEFVRKAISLKKIFPLKHVFLYATTSKTGRTLECVSS